MDQLAKPNLASFYFHFHLTNFLMTFAVDYIYLMLQ